MIFQKGDFVKVRNQSELGVGLVTGAIAISEIHDLWTIAVRFFKSGDPFESPTGMAEIFSSHDLVQASPLEALAVVAE